VPWPGKGKIYLGYKYTDNPHKWLKFTKSSKNNT
jgi:hypothetical protein